MATLRLEIITAERQVFADDVNVVVAPGIEGELGILPHHAPLMTMLKPGELLIRKDGEETYMSVSGGFLEVRPDKVIILADACERAEEIDITRAEEAKRRAEERLKTHPPGLDVAQAQATLLRSLIRLRVAGRRRRKSTPS
ncbi:MAG: F0F1 ATP synthase subunit epsilon [Chloroflexi bacterium]|jgi:F-type H+-transporting ATPase subunit epsilon|nr:F0F1 ATP synthase subunit epsilon [Chloroflexota bacterium]